MTTFSETYLAETHQVLDGLDAIEIERLATGLGVLGTLSLVPQEIQDVYGNNPTSGMAFAHVELR